LQNYFIKILEDNMKAIIKPQYVDHIPKAVSGGVSTVLTQKSEMDNVEAIIEAMDLKKCFDRDVGALSGGELQRFAIAIVCVQKADMYV